MPPREKARSCSSQLCSTRASVHPTPSSWDMDGRNFSALTMCQLLGDNLYCQSFCYILCCQATTQTSKKPMHAQRNCTCDQDNGGFPALQAPMPERHHAPYNCTVRHNHIQFHTQRFIQCTLYNAHHLHMSRHFNSNINFTHAKLHSTALSILHTSHSPCMLALLTCYTTAPPPALLTAHLQ
jgi:hypothetical protein